MRRARIPYSSNDDRPLTQKDAKGFVRSIVPGLNTTVDNSDPQNPVVNAFLEASSLPAEVQVAQVVSDGSSDVMTFENIPQEYTNLRITICAASQSTAYLGHGFYLAINDDTGTANYFETYIESAGTLSTGNAPGVAGKGGPCANVPGQAGASYQFGAAEGVIANYASDQFYKLWGATYRYIRGDNPQPYTGTMSLLWGKLDPVTRLDFRTWQGNYVAGSTITLYGQR